MSVADPGFPLGGRGPRRGGVDSRGGYVSKILYVKMKEFGPKGGRAPGTPPLDPPMGVIFEANKTFHISLCYHRHCKQSQTAALDQTAQSTVMHWESPLTKTFVTCY